MDLHNRRFEKTNLTISLVFTMLVMVSNQGVLGGTLGVNYGTLGNNLPSPLEVARFLQATMSTFGNVSITQVKLFDVNPTILEAFANTGIEVTIGISNDEIINLGLPNSTYAEDWVQENVAAYLPGTILKGIAVGNEVFTTRNKALIANLVPAMENLHIAISKLNASSNKIFISSPFSLGILHSSVPPSSATFSRPSIMKPLLSFLQNNSFPFMANVYPFFAYSSDPNPFTLQYSLFDNSSNGYIDPLTKLHYTNMFDAQVDAIYSAMEHLGFSNISIMVSETGWPSLGDPNQSGASLDNAQTYINNLIKHVCDQNSGTPLRPNHSVDTFIFALFNENMKPGPTSERNYGLFKPDMTPVYETPFSQGTLSLHSSPPSVAKPPSSSFSLTSSSTSSSLFGRAPPPPPRSSNSNILVRDMPILFLLAQIIICCIT